MKAINTYIVNYRGDLAMLHETECGSWVLAANVVYANVTVFDISTITEKEAQKLILN